MRILSIFILAMLALSLFDPKGVGDFWGRKVGEFNRAYQSAYHLAFTRVD